MNEPVTDAEVLGQRLYAAEWGGVKATPWDELTQLGRDYYRRSAETVAQAVCPAEYVVVPAALLQDVLHSLNALELASTYPDLAERLCAALAKEPTE